MCPNRSSKATPTLQTLQCASHEKNGFEFDLSVLESQQQRDADAETLQFAPDEKESYEFNVGVPKSKQQSDVRLCSTNAV